MMSDSAETRIRQLELEVTRLEQQLQDVRHDVETLAPVATSVARIEEQLKSVHRELGSLRDAISAERRESAKRFRELEAQLTESREEQSKDAKSNRTTIITGTVSIITTLLLVGGTIIAAVYG